MSPTIYMKQLTHKQWIARQARRLRQRKHKRMKEMLETEGTCDKEVLNRFRHCKVELNFYRRASARELGRQSNPNLVKVDGVWMHKAKHTFDVPTEFGTISFSKSARKGKRSKYRSNGFVTTTTADAGVVSKVVKEDIEHFFRKVRNAPLHQLFFELDGNGQPIRNTNGNKVMVAHYFHGSHGPKANFGKAKFHLDRIEPWQGKKKKR